MASSEVSICSDALTLIGATTITGLSENSENARMCARHYPNSRDEMLSRVPWKCARKRVALALSGTQPIFGQWSAQFALPPDNIFVWRTSLDREEGGDGDTWDIEGSFLVCNVSVINALYIYRMTDVTAFDPLLAKAITYDLAEKLCIPLSQNGANHAEFAKMRDDTIKSAGARNGQIGTKRRYMSTTLTTEVR
jgi:hypothetical protein